jgi:BirA family biotin operon repressor/biotin-[acetyl-CoA-carboxylase] ligase
MDVSRRLAAEGELHGTVITAGFQEKGRGRIHDRLWEMDRNMSLPFTLLLRYPGIQDIPAALTLRTGLAVCDAIEDFLPLLKDTVKVKWPNDIMICSRKTAGILCEADGGNVHLGIGINAAQKDFPDHLREKAVSLALAADREIAPDERFCLLEKVLERIYRELETAEGKNWRSRFEGRLYKKGEMVSFTEGAADSGKTVTGRLSGIGQNGEIIIIPAGEKEERSFFTGELGGPVIA